MNASSGSPSSRRSASKDVVVPARMRAFGITDVGLCRASNEDAFTLADLADGANAGRWQGGKTAEWSTGDGGVLLVVSDGMGGAKAGEVASALSIEGVLVGMQRAVREKPGDGETLRRVIEQVSEKIYEAGQRPDRRGMGATLTAVLVSGMTAFVAQIGDSRAYLMRSGRIGQVTHDQSYVQMLVDAGVMTEAEAECSPKKNIVLQVMGQEVVRVVLGRVSLQKGDRLLVCSDGLTNVVDDATINAVAKPPGELDQVARALVTLTKEGGAPDNVTVIVAEIE